MTTERRERKHPRLKEYDYGQAGCYFVTICVQDRKPLLGRISVGRDAHIPPQVELSFIGRITKQYIERIPLVYDAVKLDQYVIMPNHIHLLLQIWETANGGLKAARPTLQTIVRSLKTMVTRQVGKSVWQTSYYEHVVRNQQEYLEIWKYIDENPIKWVEDRYFCH